MTYKYNKAIDSVRLNKYPNYDAFLFDRVGDTRQTHCTMKYRSECPIKYKVTRNVTLNKYSRMMLIYKIEPEI